MWKILTLLIVLMFLTGCDILFSVDEEMQAALKTKDPKACLALDESDSSVRQDRCLEKMGKKAKNPDICRMIEDKQYHDNCMVSVAGDTGSITLCDEIKKDTNKWLCIMQAAEGADNWRWCLKITMDEDRHDQCLQKFSDKDGTYTQCESMKKEYNRGDCYAKYAIKNNDPKYCEDEYAGKSSDQIDCWKHMAKVNKDAKYCAEIHHDPDNQWDNAIWDCYEMMALQLKDEKICEKVAKEGGWQAGCYLAAAEAIGGDLICKNKLSGRYQLECLYKVAMARGDPNICFDIDQSDQFFLFCIQHFAKEDPTWCEQLKSQAHKDACYKDIGQFGNQDTCNKITNPQEKFDCYHTWAVAEQDASKCSLMEKKGSRERCYHETVKRYPQKETCANIQDPKEKASCEHAVELVTA